MRRNHVFLVRLISFWEPAAASLLLIKDKQRTDAWRQTSPNQCVYEVCMHSLACRPRTFRGSHSEVWRLRLIRDIILEYSQGLRKQKEPRWARAAFFCGQMGFTGGPAQAANDPKLQQRSVYGSRPLALSQAFLYVWRLWSQINEQAICEAQRPVKLDPIYKIIFGLWIIEKSIYSNHWRGGDFHCA